MKRYFASEKFKSGIVLLEVLISITILSAGLTLVIRSFISSLRASVNTVDYSTAVILAENKLNEYVQNGLPEDFSGEKNEFESPFEKFSYEIEAEEIDSDAAFDSLNEVTLKVSWQTRRREKSVNLTTYLFGNEE